MGNFSASVSNTFSMKKDHAGRFFYHLFRFQEHAILQVLYAIFAFSGKANFYLKIFSHIFVSA
jgi:hypothetical protein